MADELCKQVQGLVAFAGFVQRTGGEVVVFKDVFVPLVTLREIAGQCQHSVVIVMLAGHARKRLDPVGGQTGDVVQGDVFHRLAHAEVAAFVAVHGGFDQALFEGGQFFVAVMHLVELVKDAVSGEILADVAVHAGVIEQQRLGLAEAAFLHQHVNSEQVLRKLFFLLLVHAVGIGFVERALLGFAQALRSVITHEVADVGVGEREGKRLKESEEYHCYGCADRKQGEYGVNNIAGDNQQIRHQNDGQVIDGTQVFHDLYPAARTDHADDAVITDQIHHHCRGKYHPAVKGDRFDSLTIDRQQSEEGGERKRDNQDADKEFERQHDGSQAHRHVGDGLLFKPFGDAQDIVKQLAKKDKTGEYRQE